MQMLDVLKRLAELDEQNPQVYKDTPTLNQQGVSEGTGVTDYSPKSQGGTRKELVAKYHKNKNPKDAEAARKAGATQKELQGVAEVRGNIDDQAGFYVVDEDGNAVSGPFASKQEAYERAAEMGRMYDVKFKGDVIPLDSLIHKIIKTLPPDLTSDDITDPMDIEQQLKMLRSPLLQVFAKLSPHDQADVTDEVANYLYDRRPGDLDEEKADEGPEILKIKSDQAKAKGEKSFKVGEKSFPVKEANDEQVDECGMMPPMGGMSDHHTPASINITADSGDELSAMLRDIMTLAGRDHHDHNDMGMAEPAGDMPPPAEVDTDGGDDMGMDEPTMMRSMIDKLNPGDDEGGDQDGDQGDDVKEYDNTPADPNKKNEFDANQFAHQENQPGQGDRMDGTSPKGHPTMEEVEKNLFLEYRRFVSEN